VQDGSTALDALAHGGCPSRRLRLRCERTGRRRPGPAAQAGAQALARYDEAVLAAGGQQRFVPVGDLTGQIGDCEPANGDNKEALLSGRVVAATALPAAPQPAGAVVWDGGVTQTLPLISADAALQQLAAAGAGGCPECVAWRRRGTRLTTARI
jgi:hypothetical protein